MTLPISFEFFPPKTPEGADKLRGVRAKLYAKRPSFCSVTYGAGGSTQEGTFNAVREILQEGVDAASHFSCIGASEDKIKTQVQSLKEMGVKRIVALRGDLPSGYGLEGDFNHASDLVGYIRKTFGEDFHIHVACYPEVHPQAKSPSADMQALLAKQQAGADAAITQYFFNADAYLRFRDAARKAGVTLDLIPGIMPILSSTQLMRFSEACGAEIPRWLKLRLLELGDDVAAIRALGVDVVSDLTARLIKEGAPSIHFYTMNQSEATLAICERVGL